MTSCIRRRELIAALSEGSSTEMFITLLGGVAATTCIPIVYQPGSRGAGKRRLDELWNQNQ